MINGSSTMSPGRHARIERCVRILVDHLHLLAIREHLRRIEFGDVFTANLDATGRRFQQLQQGATHRRLATTAFADQAECFAALDMERYTIYRVHLAGHARKQPFVDREMLLEILDLQQRRVAHSTSPARQHATQCPVRCSSSFGGTA